MANKDFTYCQGKGCALQSQCKRYLVGQRIVNGHEGDINEYWWMDHCDIESREGFVANY